MVIVEATEEHTLTVRNMSDTRPSITVNCFFFYAFASLIIPSVSSQGTDATANDADHKDIEQSPKTPEKDPFAFRNALKTDDELALLRKSQRGKPLETYHRKQNEVSNTGMRPVACTL